MCLPSNELAAEVEGESRPWAAGLNWPMGQGRGLRKEGRGGGGSAWDFCLKPFNYTCLFTRLKLQLHRRGEGGVSGPSAGCVSQE